MALGSGSSGHHFSHSGIHIIVGEALVASCWVVLGEDSVADSVLFVVHLYAGASLLFKALDQQLVPLFVLREGE